MQIGVFGAGYLGTVVSACLADFGVPVTCFDHDPDRVTAVARGNVPFFEKNLAEVVKRNVRSGRLTHSLDPTAVRKCHVIYLAQDRVAGIEDTAADIASHARPDAILVILSAVPVGTAGRIEARLRSAGCTIPVVSQPVFLTDGCAIEDFNWPDRIVLGTTSSIAVSTLKQIYRPLIMRGVPLIVTSLATAELVRQGASAFFAAKISLINELAVLCERVDADAVDLSLALGLDKKIGGRCLQAGAVFGGPIESDIQQLTALAKSQAYSIQVLDAARNVNQVVVERVIEKLNTALHPVSGTDVALLGLSFKPNTNSVTASASISLARRLVGHGARVRAFDPVAMKEAQMELNGTVRYCDSAYTATEGVDAIVVATGWPEFRALDFDRIKKALKRPVLVDTKNLLDGPRMKAMGFQYLGVGRA